MPLLATLIRFTRGVLGFATRPLTLSQVLSSASGALPVIVGAALMEPGQFAVFALLNLVGNMVTGLGQAVLFQPALIHQRHDPRSFVRARAALTLAALVALGMTLVAGPLGVSSRREVAVLAALVVLQPLYDWLRYRAIGQDRRWLVASAELLRFVLVLATPAMLLLLDSPGAVQLQGYLLLALLLPAVMLAVRTATPVAPSPWSAYRRAAGWQLTDFVAGQFVLAVPLLVLGASASSGVVAGIRLAQSLLGPLNLVFAASVNNLVADASTRSSLATARTLIATGTRLARVICAAAVSVVALVMAVIAFSGLALRGVDNGDVVLGLAVVGTYTVLSGWSGMQGMVLRVMGHQARVTAGRAVIALVSSVGFAVGYVVGGGAASVTAGFVAAAVASPLVFGPLARHGFRNALRAESPTAPERAAQP